MMSVCALAVLGAFSACAVAVAGKTAVPVDGSVDLGLLQMELHANQSEAQASYSYIGLDPHGYNGYGIQYDDNDYVPPSGSPVPSPTPGPTAAPTPGQTSAALDGGAKTSGDIAQGPSAPTSESSAVGDPHMVNLHGQRFDLLQAGEHTLIKIPRGAADAASKLLVRADAQQLGGDCMDMYFRAINVTGDWADTALSGHGSTRGSSFEYRAARSAPAASGWQQFGPVDIKVAHGRTRSGIDYLNFFARRLAEAGYPVGGLLGEDDHTAVSSPSSHCTRTIELLPGAKAAREGSTAQAA